MEIVTIALGFAFAFAFVSNQKLSTGNEVLDYSKMFFDLGGGASMPPSTPVPPAQAPVKEETATEVKPTLTDEEKKNRANAQKQGSKSLQIPTGGASGGATIGV